MATEQRLVTIGNSELFSLNLGQIKTQLKNSQKTLKIIRFCGRLGYEKTQPESVVYAIADPELHFENLEVLQLVDIENCWLNGVRTVVENSPTLKELVLHCQDDFNSVLTKNDGILCKLSDSIEKIHLNSVATGKTFELLAVKCTNLKYLKVWIRISLLDKKALETFFRRALGLEVLILKKEMDVSADMGLGMDSSGVRKLRADQRTMHQCGTNPWKKMKMDVSVTADTGASSETAPEPLVSLLNSSFSFWHKALTTLILDNFNVDAEFCINLAMQMSSLQVLTIRVGPDLEAAHLAPLAYYLRNLKEFQVYTEPSKNISEMAAMFALWSIMRDMRQLGEFFTISLNRTRRCNFFSCSTMLADTPLGLSVVEVNLKCYMQTIDVGVISTSSAGSERATVWNYPNGRYLVRCCNMHVVLLDNFANVFLPSLVQENTWSDGECADDQPQYEYQPNAFLRVQSSIPKTVIEFTISKY